MAYRYDSYDNALVIDGFENGIADSPYSGISDLRNVNTISVPGEGSVGFATSAISHGAIASGQVTSANAGTDVATFTGAANLENGMAIVFSVQSGLNVTTGTVYWIGNLSGSTFKLYSNPSLASLVDLTNGTGTFTVFSMATPKHFVWTGANNFMVDSSGYVWTDQYTTTSGYWTYTGNNTTPNSDSAGNANGNGLVYLQKEVTGSSFAAGVGWLFVFRNSAIDYTVTGAAPSWVYGWKPSDGSTGNGSGYLKTSATTNNSHEAQLLPTNQIVYCDKNYIGRWYQTSPGTVFNPTSTPSYTYDTTGLLPGNDIAQCITYLGTNIMVGGQKNVIYPWNGFSTTFNYPLLCAESNIVKMVTINTNAYIFIGNRGRIYITNGTNVTLYKKVPDHISGTVEPYFTWGGVASVKNQLYFGCKATTNAGVAIPQYGGVWAIDVDTNALRLTNKLSYGTYAGYATAMIANFTSNTPAGAGLYVGWDSGASTYGVDVTSSTPYTGGQATIDSDLIPIGTFQKPKAMTTIEYKLTRPLVSGESIVLKTRLVFDTTDTGYQTTLTDSTVGHYSNKASTNFKNAQWLQIQAILTSTASSPSYVRLKEIRLLGLVGVNTTAAQQPPTL